MGARGRRFVGKAVPGEGWRIWDNVQHRWWGNVYVDYPSALLTELNGEKSPARIVELSKGTQRRRAKKNRR